MPISLNNSDNPLGVKYVAGGSTTNMNYVFATVDGVPSGAPVWNIETVTPETLGTMRLKCDTDTAYEYWCDRGKYDIYLREMTRSRVEYTVDSEGVYTRIATYRSAGGSYDMGWVRYAAAVGSIKPANIVKLSMIPHGRNLVVTGAPSGFDFETVEIIPSAAQDVDFKASIDSWIDGDSRIASMETARVACKLQINAFPGNGSVASFKFIDETTDYTITDGNTRFLYTANTGLVFQSAATVKFYKTLDSGHLPWG